MNESRRPGIVPSLLLAIGIIVSTVLVSLLADVSWLILAGPVFMAVTLVGASALIRQPHASRRKAIGGATILGASLIVAGVIVVLTDRTMLMLMMPVFGGGAAAVVVTSAVKRSC